MNTDLLTGVFLLSISWQPALRAAGSISHPAQPSRCRRLVPFGVTIPVAWYSHADDGNQLNQTGSDFSAPRSARVKATPRSGAAKRPTLTVRLARRRERVGSGKHVDLVSPESMPGGQFRTFNEA
jgi:hypothetical protein